MQSSFSLATDIAVSPEAAFAFVADAHKLIGGHPLIHAMTLTSETTGPDGHIWRSYEVKETLKMFGFIPVPNKYHFTQKMGDGMDFICDVSSPPVTMQNAYQIEPTATGVRVTEHVTVHAPKLLMGYTIRTAMKAHQAMFQRVKETLEQQKRGN